MRLLLTGSTGLIGSNLMKTLPDGVDCVAWNPKGLLQDLKFDYIIHAAGYAQPTKFLADEVATLSVNTTMLMNLFDRLKPGGRLLYISSSEVYNGLPPPQSEEQIGTTTPQHQRACYIEGKRCGEAICMAYRRKGVDVKIARLSLAYGATRRGDTRAINGFIEQALTTKRIKLLDKGEARRTYLYIEDAVKILWDILLRGTSTVYNVGGVSQTTIAELATKIAKMTGSEVSFGDKGLDGAPDDVRLNIDKVLEEFGPREFTSLEDGLKKTIQAYAA